MRAIEAPSQGLDVPGDDLEGPGGRDDGTVPPLPADCLVAAGQQRGPGGPGAKDDNRLPDAVDCFLRYYVLS